MKELAGVAARYDLRLAMGTGQQVRFAGPGAGNNPRKVWKVPIDGSAPQKTGLKIDPSFGKFRVSSDGRRVAFQVQPPPKPEEVWVTENFLPAGKPGK